MAILLIMALCGAALAAQATGAGAVPHWLMTALCYGAGLALTLTLAAWLTPARWWRRPTLRGLAIAAGGTWACGSALALALGLPAGSGTASAMPAAAGPMAELAAGPATNMAADTGANTAERLTARTPDDPAAHDRAARAFRVHRSLNLRAGPDVGSARLAVIPAGAQLAPTGVRAGDWWQVRSGSHGQEITGWVSSLWLRRLVEQENPR